MPMSAVEAHLSICKQLQDRLQANFPDCMVVPFGAAISGHGTITSDCDICLLTEPTSQEQALFSGTSYHPILLDQQPSVQQELPQAVDSDPRMDDSFTSSSEASSTANSPSYFPHHTTSSSDRSNLQTFNAVTSCVRTIPHCSKVFAIPHARCPIVRFNFQPQGIHCDLSINNMYVVFHLYIGWYSHDNTVTVGWVQPTPGSCKHTTHLTGDFLTLSHLFVFGSSSVAFLVVNSPTMLSPQCSSTPFSVASLLFYLACRTPAHGLKTWLGLAN